MDTDLAPETFNTFAITLPLGQVIEGRVEIGPTEARYTDVFITITRTPTHLDSAKASRLVGDALAGGRALGMPAEFATRVQAILVA